ncbi:MAG: hypothetical protein JRJ84_14225 [Deltaproteobacteria bacterium]|nr:hypothetical protein [Deltaproteobacteria bacterium]
MKKIMTVAALAMLVGCGMSEDTYNDKALDAVCVWLVDCFDLYTDVDACIADSETVTVDDCYDYSAKDAKECVDALEELTCDDIEMPSACDNVYDDSECEDTAS